MTLKAYRMWLIIISVIAVIVVIISAVLIFSEGNKSDVTPVMAEQDFPAQEGQALPVSEAIHDPTPSPTPEPTPSPTTPPTARLAFVGDIMCHADQLTAAQNSSGEYDFNYAFRYITPYIQSADFAIGNLETTLVHNNFAGWPLFRSPKALAEALVTAGFDMVTTGNNHSFDAREAGVRSTIEILGEVGLPFTGTYLTPECRDEITVFEANGFTFAIINMTMHRNGICLGDYNYMTKVIYHDLVGQSQIYYELIRETMAKARALETDFIIASPHIGIEYYGTMNRQGAGHRNDIFERSDTRWHNWIRTLELFLNEGADMVMNHHPHVLLPAEFVYIPTEDGGERRTIVAYSMANFISAQRTEPRETGAIFYVDVTRDENGKAIISHASYVPTWVRQHDPTRAPLLDFTILPVTETLKRVEESENTEDLRPQDINRLKIVHNDVTHLLSGEPIPLEDMAFEYPITRRRTIDQYPGLPLWGTLPWR